MATPNVPPITCMFSSFLEPCLSDVFPGTAQYLDDLVQRYSQLGRIPPSVPRERASLQTYAFTLEHPSIPNPQKVLDMLRDAHENANTVNSMPSAYSLAYSTTHDIPPTFGVTAPHNKTRPRPSSADVSYLHNYREQEAYTSMDVQVPQSLYGRRCTQCAELQSLPPVFRAVRETYGAVSVITVTIDKYGIEKNMCLNCQAYVEMVVNNQPGLIVYDKASRLSYSSPVTVCCLSTKTALRKLTFSIRKICMR